LHYTALRITLHYSIWMGIKHLNQFVRRECPGAIKTVSFAEMAGKVIVVDASIYMYRFAADDALLENMYSMIRMFQLNGIVPIFIFDGKPPDEKRNLLNKRQRLKRIAEMHYNEVKSSIELNSSLNTADNEHMLKVLKRKFVRLHDSDYERVRTLLQALGVNYIVAPGEADVVCAQMVLKRKAHACASDDTDLFVYGCPRVLRHLNLMDQTMVMYEMSKILELLGMTMTEFRQVCVVSGTDYSVNSINATASATATANAVDGVRPKTFNLHLKMTLKLFKQYKKCVQEAEETDGIVATDFYTWLHYNHAAINSRLQFDYDSVIAINDMFETSNLKCSKSTCVAANVNPTIDYDLLKSVMAHENFIFVDTI